MPTADNAGVTIRYEVDAPDAGDADEAVVFCGDVGLGAWQFGWQHAAVAGPHTVVTPETRGVGRSDAPAGPYTVDALASDVDAVCAAEEIRNAHLVGYGLGGMVALAYANASSRPASLTVVGTPPAGFDYHSRGVWADPSSPAAVEGSLTGLLSESFRETHPDVLSRITDWRLGEDADRETFEAHRAAVTEFDVSDHLYEITTPALCIHGEADTVCPLTAAETLADGLPRGELTGIEGARHLVGVEASAAVNDLLVGWLAEHTADPLSG
ncbi:alpha/beta fold hydrolase [Halorubrum laminariae]|uniref:Alpha/beta fold hydrolase n=1 Tax=Halorubrum laminariae TaxID=1433523 RepID=A0ABD6BXE0_9EURY|nr:alpha/beta hydrolase [Halorubrum laminariae]